MKHLKLIFILNLLVIFSSCTKEEDSVIEEETLLKVPTTSTNQVTEASIYSFTINAILTNSGDTPVSEVGFVVGTSSLPTLGNNLAKTIAQLDEENGFYIIYTSIPANTTLYIRSYAINSKGVGYGNEIVFTTLADKVYNGNVTLTTQREVVDFGSNNYTTIDGSLYINGEITNLSPLNSLVIINNGFEVKNTQLLNFTGLNHLKTIGNIIPHIISIADNPRLQDFEGLENLEITRGDFYINNNSSLMNLSGLNHYKYTSAGSFAISNCNKLTSLTGLEKLQFIGDELSIGYNASLSDISALSNLTNVGQRIYILGNDELQNVIGLEKIISLDGINITGNSKLVNLSGLSNLAMCNNVVINQNSILNDLTALNKINVLEYLTVNSNNSLVNLEGLNNLSEVKYKVEIYNNQVLSNLKGLNSLVKTGQLYIHSNYSITNLEGLNSLKTITGNSPITIGYNTNLISLDGLENLSVVTGYVQIFKNTTLQGFCSLKKLFLLNPDIHVNISDNLYNPTPSIIGSDCE